MESKSAVVHARCPSIAGLLTDARSERRNAHFTGGLYTVHATANGQSAGSRGSQQFNNYIYWFLTISLFRRQSRLKDFADRCQGIVNEAMKWAPKSTRSHLQEYPNQVPTPTLAHHSGLALAFDAVLNSHSAQNSMSSAAITLAPSITKRPHCVTSDTPRFVSVLCLRSKYVGEISGLLSVLDEADKKGLADRLVKDVWDACRERSDAKHRGTLWRATAYLIICSGINRKLLHAVCKKKKKRRFI